MATQKQRSDSTRAKILKTFRSSCLEKGFEATTTQGVLAETGMSKGALYHHFRSKTEIIEAIYSDESKGAIDRAMKSVDEGVSPLQRLRDASIAWTREIQSPEVGKILFEIGPGALGVRRAKEIEDAVSLKLFEGTLQEAVHRGEIEDKDLTLTAVLMNSIVAEAALYSLRTGHSSTETLERTLNAIIDGLRKKD